MKRNRIFRVCARWTLIAFFGCAGLYLFKIENDVLRIPRTPNTATFPKTTFSAINLSKSYTVHREFIPMRYGPMFVFGVAAGNSSENSTWDIFKLYGGLHRPYYNKSHLHCCFAYQENQAVVYERLIPLRIRSFVIPSTIWSIHMTCMNVRHADGMLPLGVAVTVGNYSCNETHVKYVTPYYPLRESQTKVALGTKTAYGNISAELIIEWMEAYKYLGVDKVITYYVDAINSKALQVLEYYASTGILDLYCYEPAASDKYPRNFYTNVKQRWNDQQIVVTDAFERMSGYKYFGIIDHDEFLVPASDWTIKEMMAHFYRDYKNATGLQFPSQYYYLSWGRSSDKSDMILGSYIQRQGDRPRIDNPKSLYIPSRVLSGGVDTHTINSGQKYTLYQASPGFGTIYHYRRCRERNYTQCMNQFERVTDTTVATWAERFRRNVEKVRELLFGTRTANF